MKHCFYDINCLLLTFVLEDAASYVNKGSKYFCQFHCLIERLLFHQIAELGRQRLPVNCVRVDE